jgi:hypothetical protein
MAVEVANKFLSIEQLNLAGVPENRLMLKIVSNIADRSTKFFPVALVGMGLVATMLWAGTIVLVALDGAWSILSAI